MCPTCTSPLAATAVVCPACGAPLRRPSVAARVTWWWSRGVGEVGSPPRSVPVESADGPLTVGYLLGVAGLGVRCGLGATSWLAVPLLVAATAAALWVLGRRSGLVWPLRMVLVVLGEPPPACSTRFVHRPAHRAPHVVSLRGDHPHLDEGDGVRLLAVPVAGTRRVVWARHRTSGRIWFAPWVGWLTLFLVLVAAAACS